MSEPFSPPLLAIGLGCRTGVSEAAILSLIETALMRVDGSVAALYTLAEKTTEPGLVAAAKHLGLALIGLPQSGLQEAAPQAVTRSERVQALYGIPSVAETAALAGAGAGAVLLLPRIEADGVTCAIAIARGGS